MTSRWVIDDKTSVSPLSLTSLSRRKKVLSKACCCLHPFLPGYTACNIISPNGYFFSACPPLEMACRFGPPSQTFFLKSRRGGGKVDIFANCAREIGWSIFPKKRWGGIKKRRLPRSNRRRTIPGKWVLLDWPQFRRERKKAEIFGRAGNCCITYSKKSGNSSAKLTNQPHFFVRKIQGKPAHRSSRVFRSL